VEIEADLSCGNVETIATAITSVALYDADRPYVEALIIRFLQDREPWVRGVSAIAAGHVARIHRALSAKQIVPLIEALLDDPRTRGQAQDALDDIKIFLDGSNSE
jgi:hypothetical protein